MKILDHRSWSVRYLPLNFVCPTRGCVLKVPGSINERVLPPPPALHHAMRWEGMGWEKRCVHSSRPEKFEGVRLSINLDHSRVHLERDSIHERVRG